MNYISVYITNFSYSKNCTYPSLVPPIEKFFCYFKPCAGLKCSRINMKQPNAMELWSFYIDDDDGYIVAAGSKARCRMRIRCGK